MGGDCAAGRHWLGRGHGVAKRAGPAALAQQEVSLGRVDGRRSHLVYVERLERREGPRLWARADDDRLSDTDLKDASARTFGVDAHLQRRVCAIERCLNPAGNLFRPRFEDRSLLACLNLDRGKGEHSCIDGRCWLKRYCRLVGKAQSSNQVGFAPRHGQAGAAQLLLELHDGGRAA